LAHALESEDVFIFVNKVDSGNLCLHDVPTDDSCDNGVQLKLRDKLGQLTIGNPNALQVKIQ
jgi:hypothetical protein